MPETKADILDLKLMTNTMNNELIHIKKALDDNKEEHIELKVMIGDFIKSAEKKYAPMWAASAIKYVITIGATAVIGAVIALVII